MPISVPDACGELKGTAPSKTAKPWHITEAKDMAMWEIITSAKDFYVR